MQNLILIPGLLNDERLWKYQIKALNHQAHMIIPEIKGYSDITAQARYILETAPEKFALAGLSMGGYIAMEILKQAPERVTKAAFLDTTWLVDETPKRKQREDMINLSAHGRFEGVTSLILKQILAEENLKNHALVAEIKDMAKRVGQKEFVNQQKLILSRTDSQVLFSQLHIPALCLVGAQDKITPIAVMKEMAEALPKGYYCEIAGAGHLPPLEQPNAVNAAMQIWLQM